MKTKTLSLRPYPGEILLCGSLKELRRQYEKLFKEPYPYEDDLAGGRYIQVVVKGRGAIWLIFAASKPALAHEFAHVLLHTFELIGCDPAAGNGEPFCYMLSQLLIDAK